MTKRARFYGGASAALLLLVGWAVFFHYYPLEDLISRFGIQNVYLATFVLSVIGGFSFVTGTSLYAGLIVLARAGVNPYVLGIIAGAGIFISDSLFYFVAMKVRPLLMSATTRSPHVFNKVWKWIYRTPRSIVFFAIYLYAAFVPFPNDVLLAVLALSGYQYEEFFPLLLLGDVTMALLLTVVASGNGM